MKQYKIMDKNTGLYSSGGYEPNWSNKGKTYNTIGQATSAIKLYARGQRRKRATPWVVMGFSSAPPMNSLVPDNWVVVEFQTTPIKEHVAKDLI
jgi:hypothetical protein